MLCTVVNCLSILFLSKFSAPYKLLFLGRTAVLPSFLADAVAVFCSCEFSFRDYQGWIKSLAFLFVFFPKCGFSSMVLWFFPQFFLITYFFKCQTFIFLSLFAFPNEFLYNLSPNYFFLLLFLPFFKGLKFRFLSLFSTPFINQPLSCFSFLNFILYFSLSPHFLSEIQFHRM